MATGVRTTYTDTSIQKRVISAMIRNIDWNSAPLLKRLGVNNENLFRFINWPPADKLEWLEDTNSPTADTLAVAITSTSATTIQVTNGSYFRSGHLIDIDTEKMWVSAVAGNALTVTRSVGGTSAATHLILAPVSIRGIAKLEGDVYVLGNTTTTSNAYNYPQEIEESIEVTWKQKGISDYGVDDTMAYHLSKLIGGGPGSSKADGDKGGGGKGKEGVLARHLENMAWYGKRAAGSATTPKMAGGFDQYITTNSLGSTSTELTRPLVHQMIRQIRVAGGSPDLWVLDAWGMEKVADMYSGTITTSRTEKYGGSVISNILTPLGDVELFWDWMAPPGTSYFLDTSKVGWVTLEPFDVYEMPSLGTYDVNMVWGVYSFVVLNEKSHGKLVYSTTL